MSYSLAHKDPSIILVILSAIAVAYLGALGGFMLLASVPLKSYDSVAEYKEFINENKASTILHGYHFKASNTNASNWAQKRSRLYSETDTVIEISDAEINAWIKSYFRGPQPIVPNKDNPRVGLPDFFIDHHEGVFFNIRLHLSVSDITYTFIGKGNFSESTPVTFELTSFRVSDAAWPFWKKHSNYLLEAVFKPFLETKEFAEFKKAWSKVKSAELVGNKVRLTLD